MTTSFVEIEVDALVQFPSSSITYLVSQRSHQAVSDISRNTKGLKNRIF